MKSLIATAILLASGSAIAHDTSFSADSCDVDLSAGITINQSDLTFTRGDEELYKIVANKHLIIDGESLDLSPSQQQIVSQYSQDIRAVVPEVKDLALEAIDLASEGVNLAFNELLGEGNDVAAELTEHLSAIKHDIDVELDLTKEISIDEHGNFGDGTFGDDFEQRIEQAVESTIKNSMGTLLIAIGQEMLFSGGDTEAIETRMESFGEQIEQQMEERGQAIEAKAEALCHSVVGIDVLEEAMKLEIEALQNIDVLSTSKKSDAHSI